MSENNDITVSQTVRTVVTYVHTQLLHIGQLPGLERSKISLYEKWVVDNFAHPYLTKEPNEWNMNERRKRHDWVLTLGVHGRDYKFDN